ncbi:hypothetical protein HD554DRAFT_1701840 [Boletus coccyginus]|nr:hypothetical protein HD554DRAFT_1701840 [Boletus coccyginus]
MIRATNMSCASVALRGSTGCQCGVAMEAEQMKRVANHVQYTGGCGHPYTRKPTKPQRRCSPQLVDKDKHKGYINIIHQSDVTMYLKSLFPSPGRVKSPSPDLTLSIRCLLDCTSRIMACQSRINGRGSEERIVDDNRHQTDLRDRDHRQRPFSKSNVCKN